MNLDDMSVEQLQALRQQKVATLTDAIHQNESGGASDSRADIVNPASGARGSMQVMKDTATSPGYGVKPSRGTPEDDARMGRDYYHAMLDQFKDPTLAAVAYNWGPGNAQKWAASGGDLNKLPLETLKYIRNFKAQTGATGAPALPPAAPAGNVPVRDSLSPGEQMGDGQWQAPEPTLGGRIVMGLGDFLRPAARGVVAGLGAVGNQLAPNSDFTRQAQQAVQQIDQTTADQNQAFAAQPGLPKGTDWVRTAAGIAPAFLVPAGAAKTLAGKALLGAGQGAVLGAGATKEGESYGANALLGAATGGVGAAALGAAGNVVRGVIPNKYAKQLIDKGVTPTPGQLIGGALNTTEQKLSTVPFAGDAVAAARRGTVTDMNRGLYKSVLDEVGAPTVPKGATVAEAVNDIQTKLGSTYDNLLPQMSVRTDQQFAQDMQKLTPKFGKLPADMQKQFNSILDDNILTQTSQHGVLNGEDMKAAQAALREEIASYTAENTANARRMAELLKETQRVFRDAIKRQNPDQAPKLEALDRAYAKFKVVQNAASRVNNPENPIMPGQLQAAIKAQDRSADKAAYARGSALLKKEFGDPSMAVLGSTVPDSGTAGRAFMTHSLAGALGGTLVMHPGVGLGVGALAAAYGTNAGRQTMFALLARRPDLARQLGAALGGIAPQAGGAAALYGVNNQ